MKASRRSGIATRIGLGTLLALAPVALYAQAQDPVTTFHVDVKLVSIFVNVTDKNGALVGGLTQDDFAVTKMDGPSRLRSSSGSRSCR